MNRALEILASKFRLRHQSSFQLCFGAGKQISLPCLLCSLHDEIAVQVRGQVEAHGSGPRRLLSQSHQGTQHLARVGQSYDGAWSV